MILDSILTTHNNQIIFTIIKYVVCYHKYLVLIRLQYYQQNYFNNIFEKTLYNFLTLTSTIYSIIFLMSTHNSVRLHTILKSTNRNSLTNVLISIDDVLFINEAGCFTLTPLSKRTGRAPKFPLGKFVNYVITGEIFFST